MEILFSMLLAQLAKIDFAGIAKDKLPSFVKHELQGRLNSHVSRIAAKVKAEGWDYSRTTEDRPIAPHALIGDLVFRFEKGIVPGGGIRDFIRDHIEISVTELVAPEISPETPLTEVAQKTADAIIQVIF